ncbi:MAG TPA: hypothetical protein P5061_02190 [Mycobacterium sp.]|nr:hypothetical protein [Mycobacterium sp.]
MLWQPSLSEEYTKASPADLAAVTTADVDAYFVDADPDLTF